MRVQAGELESSGGGSAEERQSALLDEARALKWYHTLELPGGYVTPGYFDLRAVSRKVPIPPSLSGLRCLDLASSDGFWAFEMARRGAEEVVRVGVGVG